MSDSYREYCIERGSMTPRTPREGHPEPTGTQVLGEGYQSPSIVGLHVWILPKGDRPNRQLGRVLSVTGDQITVEMLGDGVIETHEARDICGLKVSGELSIFFTYTGNQRTGVSR